MQLGSALFDRLNAEQRVGRQQPIIYGKGGMSDAEITDVERQLGFPMPDDFKYLLKNMKDPGNVMFPWKQFDKTRYDDLIGWVLSGIEFDVEHNVFWLQNRWGPRPELLEDCLTLVRKDFASWPKLLPLLGHRFLPATPCLPDNPVFSIMQTDIVYYGSNLASYLLQEFIPNQDHAVNTSGISRKIDVWTDIVEAVQ